jgi:hypothetical protein
MKQLALAMYSYQDDHGQLPPAVVYGADGEPLYSWRVLLLPYISQEKLYNKFKLNEAWDSPHNYELLYEMPGTYAPPPGKRSKAPAYHTFCKVFVGKGAAFEGQKGLRLSADFPDGISNTILIAEAGEPVPWTKPQDLPYDPDQPLPDLRGLFKDSFRAGMADGSMRWLKWDLSEATLRALITRNGDDKVGPDW